MFGKLDDLIGRGLLKSWTVEDLDIEGNVVKEAKGSRNYQRLKLVFPDGTPLVISTWCSGCMENTGFHIEG